MKNFMVYLIGISGSGKTTIGKALALRLKERGKKKFQYIDGDDIRDEIGNLFGYSFEERMKNNRVVCVVADYLIRNDVSVILTQVAPYKQIRDQVKGFFEEDYVEIYVKCSLEECARRDVKGYYSKYKEGMIENLNGANDIFEIPTSSDLIIDTEKMTVEEGVDAIIDCLSRKGYEI